MEFNDCHAGHKFHDRIVVDTFLGEMLVYDWEKYKDQKNVYCTGQDDISRTLINTGVWEDAIYGLFSRLLERGNKRNVVIDIGSNIGWYSRMADWKGYVVHSYDGNEEHIDVLKQNCPKAIEHFIWFDDKTEKQNIPNGIEIWKCDIEGNEQYAVKAFEDAFENKQIKNIIIEVSPTFNGSYPELIKKIVNYGYTPHEIMGEPFNMKFDFIQKDLWLTRND